MSLYHHPEYYEIAFGFRDVRQEVNFYEAAIERYAKTPVRRVIELASGTAPHLEEWARRGYEYTGLDISAVMTKFATAKARRSGIDARIVRGDMRRFERTLGPFELAYVTMGSIYVRSNREFIEHLDNVSAVLAPGSLYIIDGFVRFKLLDDNKQSWTMRRGRVSVRTTYRAEMDDPIEQTYFELLSAKINDHGKKLAVESRLKTKLFFPQEFLCVAAASGAFEFMGWFNNFDMRKAPDQKGRSVVILRKR